MLRTLASVAIAAHAFAAVPAYADERVALLIGNSEYVLGSPPLRTPVNDAAALDQSLNRLGFNVTRLTDAKLPEMQQALADFAERAKGAQIALFFFSGHAVQLAATNYLLATSIPEVSRKSAIYHALDTREILKAMQTTAPGIGIIILDTSHHNPLTRERDGLPPIAKPGLALPKKEDVEDLFVTHMTDVRDPEPGGQLPHSACTVALLGTLEEPGLTVRQVFRRVSSYSNPPCPISIQEDVLGSHYLNKGPPAGETAEEKLVLEAIRAGDPALIAEYERRYPDGDYRSILDRVEEWLLQPRPPKTSTPETRGVDIAEIPPADRPRLRAALTVLGLYSNEDIGVPDQRLQVAAKRYLNLYKRERLVVNTLIADAGRRALLVGAVLGKDISRDLQQLSAIEFASESAQEKLKTLEEVAISHPNLEDRLAGLREQVKRIQSKASSYKRLLDRTWDLYAQYLDWSQMLRLPEPDEAGTMVPSGNYQRLFRKHVQAQHESDKLGTYSWLEDFRPLP